MFTLQRTTRSQNAFVYVGSVFNTVSAVFLIQCSYYYMFSIVVSIPSQALYCSSYFKPKCSKVLVPIYTNSFLFEYGYIFDKVCPFVHTNPASLVNENAAFQKRSPVWIDSKRPFSCCSVDDKKGTFRKHSPDWIHWKTQFSCSSVDAKLSMRFRYEVSVFKLEQICVGLALILDQNQSCINFA